MNQKALEAAAILAAEGIEMEVIDPRTLVPYDRATVARSIAKTGRLLVTHQAPERAGVGAEIIACALEDAFDYFDAPPGRVCGKNVPIPYNMDLEAAVIPQTEDIVGRPAAWSRDCPFRQEAQHDRRGDHARVGAHHGAGHHRRLAQGAGRRAVQTGEPLFMVETDKATSDAPAPAAGILARVLDAEGETVAVG